MRPNNQFTRPDQRFFLPTNNQAEYHDSFAVSGKPAVEVLSGESAYEVITAGDSGETIANKANFDLHSGDKVRKIVATNIGYNALSRLYEDELLRIEDPAASYEPDQGDLLVVKITSWQQDSALHEQADENSVILLPAHEPLPYLSGEQTGSQDEKANFQLLGVITTKDTLVGWRGDRGPMARHLVDLCVVNVHAQNALEHALLINGLRGGSDSLLGLLDVTDVALAYLRYYDKKHRSQHNTKYVPKEEPHREVDRFPEMTEEEFKRYKFITQKAFEAWNQERPDLRRPESDAEEK